jgi:hypothetical protein
MILPSKRDERASMEDMLEVPIVDTDGGIMPTHTGTVLSKLQTYPYQFFSSRVK